MDEIILTCPFPNFNGCTIEFEEWISNFIPHFIMDVIYAPQNLHTIVLFFVLVWFRIFLVDLNCDIHMYLPHYIDVIMSAMASQIIGVSIVCSVVCSSADQRKITAPRHWPFVRGIHWRPLAFLSQNASNRRKMFPLDDVIMLALM